MRGIGDAPLNAIANAYCESMDPPALGEITKCVFGLALPDHHDRLGEQMALGLWKFGHTRVFLS